MNPDSLYIVVVFHHLFLLQLEEGRVLELEAVELKKKERQCPYKMVFVVNAEQQMSAGRAAVQIGHATIGMHKALLGDPRKYKEMLIEWEAFG